uniref:Uncharacterized protein n=2 Tax=Pygocentrus nattereri TaxID=42514 RepID=A0A3B4CN45_PYGNA
VMCRSDPLSFTLPARRTTEPEIFTFDRIPAAQPVQLLQCARPRPRRRPLRVLYPSTGRRYLPRAERSPVKRWLLALCLVVLLQIYSEDDVAVAAEDDVTVADETAAFALRFASAEERARRLTEQGEGTTPARTLHSLLAWRQDETCAPPASPGASWQGQAVREQSARSNGGYVVALLYPVYHTLGSEQ